MVCGIGETREACLALAGKYHDRHLADRVFELASTHGSVALRQINATESDAQLYARLASSVLYANPALRADAAVLMKNRRGQSALWGYAISGDLPIVLASATANIDPCASRQAHAYWRLKARGRPRDLERGSRRLPAAAPGPDPPWRRRVGRR